MFVCIYMYSCISIYFFNWKFSRARLRIWRRRPLTENSKRDCSAHTHSRQFSDGCRRSPMGAAPIIVGHSVVGAVVGVLGLAIYWSCIHSKAQEPLSKPEPRARLNEARICDVLLLPRTCKRVEGQWYIHTQTWCGHVSKCSALICQCEVRTTNQTRGDN